MVLIIKKIRGKRCDLILIPKRLLEDMLERHVDRKGLAKDRQNTCLVSSGNNWTKKPSHQKVIKLILESLQKQRVLEGENRYPISHHLFGDLKCRNFNWPNKPITDIFEGDFQIRFIRIRGGSTKTIATVQNYEKLSAGERIKIKNTFEKVKGQCEKEFVFLVHHLHPAKR